MTYDETIEAVLEKVRSTPGWYLAMGFALRRDNEGCCECPVTADTMTNARHWEPQAAVLQYDLDAARDIVCAADDDPAYRTLNARLLEAAGMQP